MRQRVPGVPSLGGLLRLPLAEARALLEAADDFSLATEDAEVAAPVDGLTDVWAAGSPTSGPVRRGWRRARPPRTCTSVDRLPR